MFGPRVYNGHEWLPIPAVGTTSIAKPVEPILDGDGKIFVSIVSYRGTSTASVELATLFLICMNV